MTGKADSWALTGKRASFSKIISNFYKLNIAFFRLVDKFYSGYVFDKLIELLMILFNFISTFKIELILNIFSFYDEIFIC